MSIEMSAVRCFSGNRKSSAWFYGIGLVSQGQNVEQSLNPRKQNHSGQNSTPQSSILVLLQFSTTLVIDEQSSGLYFVSINLPPPRTPHSPSPITNCRDISSSYLRWTSRLYVLNPGEYSNRLVELRANVMTRQDGKSFGVCSVQLQGGIRSRATVS